jgi:nitrite reductase/ring-hydroxylating ferredoxin subunit
MMCTCHGAVFDLNDGRVVEGPAQAPLRLYSVKIVNGELHVEL